MPQLNTTSNLEQIVLPSYADLPEDQQAWVVMDVGDLTAGDVKSAQAGSAAGELMQLMLVSRIKEWNFEDAEGKRLEISLQNVQKIKLSDYQELISRFDQESEGLDQESLKASSSSSVNVPVTDIPV